MRSDMAKVIVERPRRGSRMRGRGKGYLRDMQRIPLDEQPTREGIKRAVGSDTKNLNEHLGPLRRYLRKQVGRPWDKVFAEICAHISRDNAVQDHVRDHVFDYVATKVREIDGVLFAVSRWGALFPLAQRWYRPHMYVCPRTGILKLVKSKTGRGRKRPQNLPDLHVAMDHDILFIRKLGVWFRVKVEAFPRTAAINGFPLRVHDALQGTSITRTEAVKHYGQGVVAGKVRLASREEIRQFCEPLKAPNVVR